MSSATPMFEVGAVVLGYVGFTAAWRRASPQYVKKYQPMLTIQTCASTDEGVHEPAASVTINSREGLIALRSAIDEALKEVEATQ
jgi:hypothetical protein